MDTEASRAEALAALDIDKFAPTTRDKRATMWRTIELALAKFDFVPLPPSREKLQSLGAALKAGSYSSADNYLVHYRIKCEEAGMPYDSSMQRLHLDVLRSCKRGLGGPCRALALPLLRLHDLDLMADKPWCRGGPVGPACAMVAGAWFLMREVELATTRAHLVSLEKGPDGEDVVRWHLPASKTDVEARGVSRVHGCSCLAEGRVGSCPFHAAKFQFARLRRLFPEKWKKGDGIWSFPSSQTNKAESWPKTS